MKAAIFKGKGAIELGERPDPTIRMPTDAVVRVALTCVCGSDLWYYRGQSDYAAGSPIGHEFVGVVEQVGEGGALVGAEDHLAGFPDHLVRLQGTGRRGDPGRLDADAHADQRDEHQRCGGGGNPGGDHR